MNGFLNGKLRVGEAPALLKTKRHSIKSLALVSKVGCITVVSPEIFLADTRVRVLLLHDHLVSIRRPFGDHNSQNLVLGAIQSPGSYA